LGDRVRAARSGLCRDGPAHGKASHDRLWRRKQRTRAPAADVELPKDLDATHATVVAFVQRESDGAVAQALSYRLW